MLPTKFLAATINDPCKAYGLPGCPDPYVSDPLALASSIVSWMSIAIGILCVVFIIVAAIQIMTSGGDAEKVKRGRRTLLYSIIGLAVAILAGVIVGLVFDIAGSFN